VRRRIGSGGFATVWLAYDEQLDSPVAIKVLADNWTEDHHVRQRFLEEGRFLRKVESPYVVSVYDAGELDDGRPYLVMSYADQGTLADRLEIEGLTPGQALEVIREIGQGLTALHVRNVLHRDVKPANVLFRTVDGSAGPGAAPKVQAMVGDLGLGKALEASSRLTMIAGTPSFVAPEQAQAEHLDSRADQYSLAALTFLLLNGRAPYAHASLQAAAHPGPPPPLSTEARPFPAAVEDVVRRGLAVDREDRWPAVADFVSALEDSLGPSVQAALPEPWLPPDPDLTQPGRRPTIKPEKAPLPSPALPPRSRRGLVVAAVVGVLALVAGFLVGPWLYDRAHPDRTVEDATGTLAVTVPRAWTTSVHTAEWTPPDSDGEQPSLSLGSSSTWQKSGSTASGVFLGVFSSDDMPEQLAGHPECGSRLDPFRDTVKDGASLTQVNQDCPGVVIERVLQVATNQFVWIQVRSADRPTANQVLDSVEISGY
jgi:serine/threonine protein kinase